MLTGHRNEDLAEMLEDAEAGANPEALLRTVVGAVIELREAAHLATVPPTDYSDEGDSGADEGEEEEEEATVMTEERVPNNLLLDQRVKVEVYYKPLQCPA